MKGIIEVTHHIRLILPEGKSMPLTDIEGKTITFDSQEDCIDYADLVLSPQVKWMWVRTCKFRSYSTPKLLTA